MKKGFTLIELLVVIVIIGVLVAIALPNFMKIKEKAREAETKSSLHSIQIALERYATDSRSGQYPFWIAGGDWTDSWVINETYFERNVTQQDVDNLPPGKQDLEIAPDGFGCSLIMEGYLERAPRNAFIITQRKGANVEDRTITHYHPNYPGWGQPASWTRAQVGGVDNRMMVEILGPPHAMKIWRGGDVYVHHMYDYPNAKDDPLRNVSSQDGWSVIGNPILVGNFLYYPFFATEEENWIWLNATGEPAGFHLVAFGSKRNVGWDVYDRNANWPDKARTVNCDYNITILGLPCPASPGDPNTWTQSAGGPDGVKDGAIVVLSSGTDVKTEQKGEYST